MRKRKWTCWGRWRELRRTKEGKGKDEYGPCKERDEGGNEGKGRRK